MYLQQRCEVSEGSEIRFGGEDLYWLRCGINWNSFHSRFSYRYFLQHHVGRCCYVRTNHRAAFLQKCIEIRVGDVIRLSNVRHTTVGVIQRSQSGCHTGRSWRRSRFCNYQLEKWLKKQNYTIPRRIDTKVCRRERVKKPEWLCRWSFLFLFDLLPWMSFPTLWCWGMYWFPVAVLLTARESYLGNAVARSQYLL